MKPGRYNDIPIEQYHSGDGVSRSTLKALEDGTPLSCKHYMENGIAETPAMALGSAVDCLVYEPQLYPAQFAVRPTFSGTGSKQARIDWEEENAGRTILSEAQSLEAMAIANAVRKAPSARALQKNAKAQESWYWEEEGTLCKTRPDGYDETNGWTFDLKTVYSLTDRVIDARIVDGCYDVQAAMNFAAARALGLPWNGHVLIWAEKAKPFDVRCQLIEVGSNWLSYGLSRFMRLRHHYQTCVDSGQWPGYAGSIEPARAPKWVVRKLEDEDFLSRAEARS